MPQYVLIYNGDGAGEHSTTDLKELFSCDDIYGSRPTVTLTDFTSNFDQLTPENTTVVLPGGTVVSMGRALFPQKEKIKGLINLSCA